MKKTLVSGLIFSTLLMSSCATILDGNRNASHVKIGTPTNAKVFYNGEYMGEAPCRVPISKSFKKGESKIEIKADGYEMATVTMTRKVSVGFVLLDICTGVFPLIIDFATGNIYKPRPNRIDYHLIAKANETQQANYKPGDKVFFSAGKLKHQEGTILAAYPAKALVSYKDKKGNEQKIEVAYVDLAKGN